MLNNLGSDGSTEEDFRNSLYETIHTIDYSFEKIREILKTKFLIGDCLPVHNLIYFLEEFFDHLNGCCDDYSYSFNSTPLFSIVDECFGKIKNEFSLHILQFREVMRTEGHIPLLKSGKIQIRDLFKEPEAYEFKMIQLIKDGYIDAETYQPNKIHKPSELFNEIKKWRYLFHDGVTNEIIARAFFNTFGLHIGKRMSQMGIGKKRLPAK